LLSTEPGPRLPHLSDAERRQLVERLLNRRRQAGGPVIETQPRTGAPFPVSFAQQRMWLLHQLAPLTSTFSVGQGLWFRGDLDREALRASISDIVARHESLRTTFQLIDGQPMQVIAPALDVALEAIDVRQVEPGARIAGVTREARAELRRPWDLADGPLLRARLWQTGDSEYAFFIGMHHIVCDGWSLGVLMKELIESYWQRASGAAPARADLPIQYADYSVWQRRWLEGDGPSSHLDAWQRMLSGAPRLRLPAGNGAAPTTSSTGKRVTLPADVTQKVKALAAAQNVTPFMVLLAAYAMLLSRYSGQDDIVVGSPVASRTHGELENVVGCFMNPLPFRVDLSGNPTFRELVARVGRGALEVYANQQIPFDVLVRLMDPARQSEFPPLYQAMFLFHNFPWEKPRVGAAPLQISSWPFLADGQGHEDTELVSDQVFPVTLDLLESGGVITGFLEYTSQFAGALADAPAEFRDLVEASVADPDRRIGRREAPTAPAIAQPVEPPIGDAPDVLDAFERQVASTPDATAIATVSGTVTYAELGARTAQLAARLRQAGLASGAPVAVLLERSVDAIAALLAVLRAGSAYLPIDPALPAERISYMLRQAGVSTVVTSGEILGGRTALGDLLAASTVVRVDDESSAIPNADRVAVTGEHLAYVLFTSGSSGRPKAVAIPRRALSNYVAVASRRFGLQPHDRVLQFASLSFDTAAEEIFPALTSGAALVLRTEAMLQSAPAFLAACGEWRISVLDLPTAYWHELTAQVARSSLRVPGSIRLVILGGEKALAPRVREWRAAVGPDVRLLNTYGPTESTIVATMWDLTVPDGTEEIPIGRAVDNVRALVLDRDLRPVRAGVVDELWIGGVQLAHGYLNDPALTAERFVPDPGATVPGSRLYRTGDLASARADGVLEFAGRADDQVKLRGFRIEPGEIETVLLQHPDVLEAAVVVRKHGLGELRLAAYVACFEGRAVAAAGIRRFLQERLPDYMIPAAFMMIDKLPRTVQRKVDREALPPVDWSAGNGDAYQAPRTQLEGRIAAVWAEVLERDRVGVHDNFFDLGGHSLLVIKLHARLTEEFGADLSPVDLFQFTTVSSQAERLAQPAARPAVALGAAQDRAARQRQAFRRLGK
jgi:amino acid adenylation domain-containing protein